MHPANAKKSPPGNLVDREEKQNLRPTIDLDDDMLYLCRAFRVNSNSQALLTYFDACTPEDFCLMTKADLEDMILHAARSGRPFPPLQQRKVALLASWLRRIVQESSRAGPFTEEQGVELESFRRMTIVQLKKREMDELTDETDDDGDESAEQERQQKAAWRAKFLRQDSFGDSKYSLLPPNWKTQFQTDLPALKKELRDVGEKSNWSAWSNFFINLRWALCGYDS